jgi:2-C-methyl-D-erythritol 4-phosphate cytidylyltransferase
MAPFHVIIPAAGCGKRMKSEVPKQYLPILGKPLIQHTIAVFAVCPAITSITIAISADDGFWDDLNISLPAKATVLRRGGESRADTVLNVLQGLKDKVAAEDWILVHDAVRPGLSADTLDNLLHTLQYDPVGGILAVPLADTLKRGDDEQRVAKTEPRDHLWQAQTPQMFRYALLREALLASGGSPTDEAQAIEALGLKPRLVHGEIRNLKVTYPQDLELVKAILSHTERI